MDAYYDEDETIDRPGAALAAVNPSSANPAGPIVERAPAVHLVAQARNHRIQAVLDAKAKGYEGDACVECGAMTMVRNGSCLKCMSCGSTSGCS